MPSPLSCPSCAAPLETQRFARHLHGEVVLDVCWTCHAIWFDQYESAQLSSAAVIAVFRLIHEHRQPSPRALGERLHCPRCHAALALTHDRQRNTRLRYHRCPAGHGRLTTFLQFLREKEFVRSLSQPEIETLKATVTQVRCSSCGAVIDLGRDVACPYCRAPLAVLDGAAVEKALAALSEADRRQHHPDADAIAARFESLLAQQRAQHQSAWWMRDRTTSDGASSAIDLVATGIGLLFNR